MTTFEPSWHKVNTQDLTGEPKKTWDALVKANEASTKARNAVIAIFQPFCDAAVKADDDVPEGYTAKITQKWGGLTYIEEQVGKKASASKAKAEGLYIG